MARLPFFSLMIAPDARHVLGAQGDSIEVFKTDIATAAVGAAVGRAIRQQWRALRVSVDLDDSDRVLRVVAPDHWPGLWVRLVSLVQSLGVTIEALPD